MGVISNLGSKVGNLLSPCKVDDLKAQIVARNGLAPADRFMLVCAPPIPTPNNTDLEGLVRSLVSGSFVASATALNPRGLSILCESITFPGRVMNTIEGPDKGHRNLIKTAVGYTNDDVTASFLVTNDLYALKVFSGWQAKMINKSNYTANYPTSYESYILIQTMNQQNAPTHGIALTGAYPINVQSLALDSNSTDTIHRLSVTFAYKDFEEIGSSRPALIF